MLGFEGVLDLIAARVESAMPAKVTEIRGRLGLDVPEHTDARDVLVAPMILKFEPETYSIQLASFPAVYLIDRSTTEAVRSERGQYGDTWRMTYTITFVVWVRDDSLEAVKTQLRRLTLAFREMLVQLPMLATQDGLNAATLLTFGEQIGTPAPSDVGIIAGSTIETTWQVYETASKAPGLPVDEVEATVTQL